MLAVKAAFDVNIFSAVKITIAVIWFSVVCFISLHTGSNISKPRPYCFFTLHSYGSCQPLLSSGDPAPLRACLRGGGGPQIGEVTCGGSPHLSCKRDQIKMRDHVDRQVTHQSGSPHLPRVPNLRVSRPLEGL